MSHARGADFRGLLYEMTDGLSTYQTVPPNDRISTICKIMITISGMLGKMKSLTVNKYSYPPRVARPLTVEQLRQLPTISLEQAAAVLGIGRTAAYQMARNSTSAGETRDSGARFPCRIIRVGTHYRVPTPGLLHLLCDHTSS